MCASIPLDENNQSFQISDQAVKSADQAARIGTGVVWVLVAAEQQPLTQVPFIWSGGATWEDNGGQNKNAFAFSVSALHGRNGDRESFLLGLLLLLSQS